MTDAGEELLKIHRARARGRTLPQVAGIYSLTKSEIKRDLRSIEAAMPKEVHLKEKEATPRKVGIKDRRLLMLEIHRAKVTLSSPRCFPLKATERVCLKWQLAITRVGKVAVVKALRTCPSLSMMSHFLIIPNGGFLRDFSL